MHIPPDDLLDLEELTTNIVEYIFDKTKECDGAALNNVLMSVFSTLLINAFDHPAKAFIFIEKLCNIMESLSQKKEEEDE